jgi:type I restriction enzyme M protein
MGFNMSYLERAVTDGHAKLSGEGKQQKILYVAVNHTERYADPEEQVRAEFWAELIYRYGYEPARIGVEITVPDRTPSDRADLVVFRDDERKKPCTVIECKADGVTDAEFNQAVEQACGNGTWAKFRTNYVGVVAGITRPWVGTVRCAVRCPRFPVPGGQGFSSFRWPKTGEAPAGPSLRDVPTTDGCAQALEREANIIADLPRQYDKPEAGQKRTKAKGQTLNAKMNSTRTVSAFSLQPSAFPAQVQPVSKEAIIGAIKKCHQTLWAGGKLSPPAAL